MCGWGGEEGGLAALLSLLTPCRVPREAPERLEQVVVKEILEQIRDIPQERAPQSAAENEQPEGPCRISWK